MLEFLPEKLQGLSGIQLYGSIVWLFLIIVISTSILLIKPIMNLTRNKSKKKLNNEIKQKKHKGF